MEALDNRQFTWLVTGAGGFIGSNICEFLLLKNQRVIAVDNFITGKRSNIDDLINLSKHNSLFSFIEGDLQDIDLCLKVTEGVDYVLHQAALGSVPRSIVEPVTSHANNVNVQLNILESSRVNKVKKVIYASSSSVYGDEPNLPKREEAIGNVLSPYALTKKINEQYGDVYSRVYGLENVGIRYFNVFGKRQDPDSVYAAVIPKWIKLMLNKEPIEIYGDGKTSRDFCYIENVVNLNISLALKATDNLNGKVVNCACGEQTSLNDLYKIMKTGVEKFLGDSIPEAIYKDFRAGDIRHSLADYSLAEREVGYKPLKYFSEGMKDCIDWYCDNLKD